MEKFATAVGVLVGACIGALAGVAVIRPIALYMQAQHPREPKSAVEGAAWMLLIVTVPLGVSFGASIGATYVAWRYSRKQHKKNSDSSNQLND